MLPVMAGISALCVFCGSSLPPDGRYAQLARELGGLIASRGIGLVYGGGRVGLMGEVADAALAGGGRVVGVIPTGLFSAEVAHTGLTELREVATMHERKQLMYDLSDGFIALPGGLGTLDELAEVSTWAQLGLHAKPVVLLDVDRFWDPLCRQLDRMVSVGLLRQANRDLIRWADTAEDALAMLVAAEPVRAPTSGSAITPGER
jgi:uncharacterized protein (TIGR00730 family)